MIELPINYDETHWTIKRDARKQYAQEQNGKCWHCAESLNMSPSKDVLEADINLSLFPKDFLSYPEHLHHDHNTGMTIGTVHSRCNAYLWQYKGE